MSRRAMLAPMRPNPIKPSCIRCPFLIGCVCFLLNVCALDEHGGQVFPAVDNERNNEVVLFNAIDSHAGPGVRGTRSETGYVRQPPDTGSSS